MTGREPPDPDRPPRAPGTSGAERPAGSGRPASSGRPAADGSGRPDLPPPCIPGSAGESCSICGDEGLEGEVVALDGDGRSGRVRLPDGEIQVAFDLLQTVHPGDRVIVHLGFAIGLVREERDA